MLAVPVGSVALLRLARKHGWIATRIADCQACGSHGPVVGVQFWKNTGMLIMRQTGSLSGDLCRGCVVKKGASMTAHTAVLGWWGTISFVITALILPANMAQIWWGLGLRSGEDVAGASLESQREYATALLATKDREVVIDVLAKSTGATRLTVADFVDSLRPPES